MARKFHIAFGIACLLAYLYLIAHRDTLLLSPRIPPSYDYVLTEPFWCGVGYCLLAVSGGLFLLFR